MKTLYEKLFNEFRSLILFSSIIKLSEFKYINQTSLDNPNYLLNDNDQLCLNQKNS